MKATNEISKLKNEIATIGSLESRAANEKYYATALEFQHKRQKLERQLKQLKRFSCAV